LNPSRIDFYKNYYKKLFEYTANITVNTIYLKNILLKINSELNNITILPVGLDTSLFQNKKKDCGSTSQKFKVVYCGRLIKLKGADVAVTILAELYYRGLNNLVLNIIGDGELKAEIEETIDRAGLDEVIFLKGTLTQEEIIENFETSNVFLLPGIMNPVDGRCEAQGLVIQEAQAMELPVVVSDVGGMKYGLIPNETGFVVKENDIKGFADVIQTLIENPDLARKMGKKGRDFVVKNYDSKVLCQQLLAIYNK